MSDTLATRILAVIETDRDPRSMLHEIAELCAPPKPAPKAAAPDVEVASAPAPAAAPEPPPEATKAS